MIVPGPTLLMAVAAAAAAGVGMGQKQLHLHKAGRHLKARLITQLTISRRNLDSTQHRQRMASLQVPNRTRGRLRQKLSGIKRAGPMRTEPSPRGRLPVVKTAGGLIIK